MVACGGRICRNPHHNPPPPFPPPEQAGKVVTIPGANAAPLPLYVAGANAAGAAPPKAAVVIFTDIYGFALNNTRLWADRLAAAGGFLVVVPDFFRGDALTDATRGTIAEWRTRHPKARVVADFEAVAAWLRKDNPALLKIGAQGFCWGGYYAGILSTASAPKVDAAVGFHASSLQPADIDAVAGPISLQQSDPKLDNSINTTFYAYIDSAFAAKRAAGVDARITFYEGMPHGFARELLCVCFCFLFLSHALCI